MEKILAFLTAFAIGVMHAVSPVDGCGDKFLVRCTASNIVAPSLAEQSGSILILATPGRDSIKWLQEKEASVVLTRQGHSVYMVNNDADMLSVLATTPIDLVIADIADIESLADRSVVLPGSPMMLPLVHKANAVNVDEIRARFPYLLKVPGSRTTFLTTIVVALEQSRPS